ncbi:hypothetical protein PAEPH01_2237 [Pancytospora epiphaga]|nr:hypothetical protein PAEPH01_2237 [Pancytospora epiphaga]
MDRINSFLNKRPVKHKKTIKYKNESYEITKNDLKLVRSYKSGKCLDKTLKLSRIPDLRHSAKGHLGIPLKEKPDYSEKLLEKTKKYYELHPLREKVRVDVNVIRDVWEEDTVDTLKTYNQDWVYSIKEQYDRPIEQCVFTRDDLEKELRRVYLSQFRPREVKEKPISEILPKLPDSSELKPFPEEIGQTWGLKGRKYIYGKFVCTISTLLEVVDMEYGKKVISVDMKEDVRQACGDGGYLYISTLHEILRINVGDGFDLLERVHQSATVIKDFYVSKGHLAVLAFKTVNLYDLTEMNSNDAIDDANRNTIKLLKTFVAKYENPHNVKIFNNSVYVSTANGLLIESSVESDIKTLNYVIDFTFRDGSIYVINNLCRLVVIGADYGIKKNIVQHQMGKAIKIHSVLNLLAILFSEEIGIYKYFNGEYVPVNTLAGRYKTIEWHGLMPWLYATNSSMVVLYT